MGWSEEQTLFSDMNAIIIGYEGRVNMLQAIFGSPENQDKPVLTPALFDAVFDKPRARGGLGELKVD